MAALINALDATPVDDGISHEGDAIVRRLVEFYQSQFIDYMTETAKDASAASRLSSIIRLMGRNDRVPLAIKRHVLKYSLESNSAEVRDAAVQAADLWEDRRLLDILSLHVEPLDWVRSYQKDVMVSLGARL